jgi:hypothetical protein
MTGTREACHVPFHIPSPCITHVRHRRTFLLHTDGASATSRPVTMLTQAARRYPCCSLLQNITLHSHDLRTSLRCNSHENVANINAKVKHEKLAHKFSLMKDACSHKRVYIPYHR